MFSPFTMLLPLYHVIALLPPCVMYNIIYIIYVMYTQILSTISLSSPPPSLSLQSSPPYSLLFWLPQISSLRQLQNSVQGSLEAEQLHLAVEHGLLDEHPHQTSSTTSVGAIFTSEGTITGLSDFVASSHVQPYSVGLSWSGSGSFADFQMAVWMCALKTFCSNSSVVGGSVLSSGAFESLGV